MKYRKVIRFEEYLHFNCSDIFLISLYFGIIVEQPSLMHNQNNENCSSSKMETPCQPEEQETVTDICENGRQASIQSLNIFPTNVYSPISQQSRVFKKFQDIAKDTSCLSRISQYSDPLVLVPLSIVKPYLMMNHSMKPGSNSTSNSGDSNISASITPKRGSNLTEQNRMKENELVIQKTRQNRNRSSRDSSHIQWRKEKKTRKPTRKLISTNRSEKLPTKKKHNPSTNLKIQEHINLLDFKSRISIDRKTKARNADTSPNEPFCKVCGDTSSKHSHYGGSSCYSCRAFFRRSVEAASSR